MTFLSLTLDNITTQRTIQTQKLNNINLSAIASPILNFNNNLYSIENNNEYINAQQIKEKYQDRKSILKTTANEYINNMHELSTQKCEIMSQHNEKINASINEVTGTITSLKNELQKEETKKPKDENKIAQLKAQIEKEEGKLKNLKNELIKNSTEIYYWNQLDETYEKNVSAWQNVIIDQLDSECNQELEHYQHTNKTTKFVPAEQASRRGLNYSLNELSKANAEYNANPNTENKAKLAAQIKTVHTVFDASGNELKELGIYSQISNVISNITSRLELKL